MPIASGSLGGGRGKFGGARPNRAILLRNTVITTQRVVLTHFEVFDQLQDDRLD